MGHIRNEYDAVNKKETRLRPRFPDNVASFGKECNRKMKRFVQRPELQRLYKLRYSVGVHPLISLNILMKEDMLEKPDERETSVMDMPGLTSSFSAASIRF